MEHNGDLLSQFEERNATANNDQTVITSPFEEDIIHSRPMKIPVKRKLQKVHRKTMKRQTTQTMSLRLLMMAWISTLGDPTELGSHHQNF
jgi:hypothetical protein